jgi:hypothetical protein
MNSSLISQQLESGGEGQSKKEKKRETTLIGHLSLIDSGAIMILANPNFFVVISIEVCENTTHFFFVKTMHFHNIIFCSL